MRLIAIVFLLAAGILAGAQLGKIAPLVGWYQETQGFSLVMIGWLTSMIGIFVAACALPVGWAIERVGARRSVLLGSLALVAGGLALPLLAEPQAILAARLVEGIGYVILVIALPALLAAISVPTWRPAVLAIWSCFVPVGYAVSDLGALALLPLVRPEAYLLIAVMGYAVFAAVGMTAVSGVRDEVEPGVLKGARKGIGTTINREVVLTALGFGLFVVQALPFFAFMPTFAPDAGLLLPAGLIALTVPVGNILAAFAVRGASAASIGRLSILAFLVAAAAAWPVFAGGDALVATVCAVVFVISGGVVGSALYAVLPSLVGRGGSVSIAIGLVAQAGGIGTLFGPPLAGWTIERFGWTGLGVFLAVVGVLAALVLLPNIASRRAS